MRNILLTLFITLISFPAFAHGNGEESVYDRVMRTGEIRCGYGISPPAMMVEPNTGQLSGVDYEVWEAIGKELDLEIVWAEEAGWGSYIEGLRAERFDVFCSQAWPNPVRTKLLTSAGPVIYSFLQAYVREDDNRFDGNIERINQQDISIPAIDGDVSVHMAQSHFPEATIYTLPQMATVSDMYQSVISKKADVLFLDKSFYKFLSENNGGTLKEVPDVGPSYIFSSYYGMKSGELELRDMINTVLNSFINDGRLEKIGKKYSNNYIFPEKGYEVTK